MPDIITVLRASTSDFTSKLAAAKGEVTEFSDTGSSKLGTLSKVGGAALAGIAGAAVAVGAASIDLGMKFQTSMTQLQTGAGESQKNIGLVSTGILNMAGQVGTSAQQLASGMYLVESAGYHGAAGLTVLKAAAEGAKVGNADLSTVSDAVTSALNAYGLKAKDATGVTNELVATVAAGKTHMTDLAGALSAILPTAAAAHISLAQVGGAIATMTSQGTSAQQAAQDLANTIRSLQNPSEVQIAEMEQLGLSSNKVSTGLGKNGLTGTLSTLVNAITSKMGPAGTVLLDSFKQSEAAADDANQMISKMPASLQSLAKSYQDGTMTSAQWRAALKGLPVDQKELATQFAATENASRGFNDTLKSGSPAAQTFNAALSKVMGGSTGLSTALELTGSHMATFIANTKSVGKSSADAGSNVNGFAQVQKTLQFQLDSAKDTAEALATRLGVALIPKLEAAMRATMDVVKWFEKHKVAGEALAAVIGGVLAVAIGAFIVNTGTKMVEAVGRALTSIGILSAAEDESSASADLMAAQIALLERQLGQLAPAGAAVVTANEAIAASWAEMDAAADVVAAGLEEVTVAQTELDAAMDANPIGLIVLAIVALIAVAVEVVKHWSAVSKFFEKLWGDVRRFFETGVGQIVLVVLAPFIGIPLLIIEHWGAIASFFEKVWGDIRRFFTSGIGEIILVVVAPFIGLPLLIVSKWSDITGFFSKLWSDVKRIFDRAVKDVTDVIKGWWPVILGVMTGGIALLPALLVKYWSQVSNDVHSAWSDIINFFSGIPGKIINALSSLGSLLLGWITSAWNAVRSWVEGAVSAFVGFWTSLPGKVIAAVSGFGALLIGWITSAWNTFSGWVLTAWSNEVAFWSAIPQKIINAVVGLGALLINWISTAWNNFRSWIENAWNNEVAFWSGIPGKVINALSSLGALLIGWATTAWGNVVAGFTTAWKDTSSYLGGIPGRMLSAIGDVGSLLYNAGHAILESLLNGLKAAWQDVSNFVSGIAGKIANLKGPLDYDATLLIPHGNAIMGGFLQGLQAGFNGKVAPFLAGIGSTIANTSFGATANLGVNSGITPIAGSGAAGSATSSNTQPIYLQIHGQTLATLMLPDLQTAALQGQRTQSLPIFGTTQSA